MSRATFFLGLANLVGSAFLLGAFPQSFWLVYAVQGLFIMGSRFRDSWTRSEGTPTKPSTMLYYFDLCWVAARVEGRVAATPRSLRRGLLTYR